MKYIRTKDGIYRNQGYFIVHSNEILKQADTIEELFDEYVWAKCLIEFINKEKQSLLLNKQTLNTKKNMILKKILMKILVLFMVQFGLKKKMVRLH